MATKKASAPLIITSIQGGKVDKTTVTKKGGEVKTALYPFIQVRYKKPEEPTKVYEKWMQTPQVESCNGGKEKLEEFYEKNGGKTATWKKWQEEYQAKKHATATEGNYFSSI